MLGSQIQIFTLKTGKIRNLMEHVEISAYLKLLAEKNQRNFASNFGEKNRLHQFCTFTES